MAKYKLDGWKIDSNVNGYYVCTDGDPYSAKYLHPSKKAMDVCGKEGYFSTLNQAIEALKEHLWGQHIKDWPNATPKRTEILAGFSVQPHPDDATKWGIINKKEERKLTWSGVSRLTKDRLGDSDIFPTKEMADWFLHRYREKQALVMNKGKTVTLEETTGKTADDFLVGRNVRVLMESSRSKMDGIWVESGEMQKYINCVGVVERIDEEIYVSFADGKNWYFYPEDLVPIGAKINCPETKDQPEILNFKVGDKVVVTQKFIPTKGRYNWPREMDKTIGKEFTIIEIKETCSYGTGIQLNNFWWYCPEALELVTEQSHDDADYFITEYYKDRTPTIEKQTTMDIPTNLITTPTLFRGTDITQMSSPSILSSIESLQHQKKNLSELKIESKAVAAGIKEIDSAINVLVKELDSRK